MKEMSNILGWLAMAEEKSILEDSQKHVEETYQTVKFFDEAIKAFARGDVQAKIVAIANVAESEHKADILRSKMVDELSKGLLLPPDREDLMHFVKTLDRIADWTNSAARLLGFIEQKLASEMPKKLRMCKPIRALTAITMKQLNDAIRMVRRRCSEVKSCV